MSNKSPRLSSLKLGALVLGLGVVVGYGLFHKAQIVTALRPGDTMKVDLSRDYRLRPYQSKVKIAGVPVGVVTGVHRHGDAVEVDLKIDKDVPGKLGSSPSAAIRPTTLLGGNYYMELRPGGDPHAFHGTIPVARTTLPVELDRVLENVGPPQQQGIRTIISKLNSTLTATGADSLKTLAHTAPNTLVPAGVTLQAMRGDVPSTDLADLVTGLDSTARVLTSQQQQLDALLQDTAGTAQVLATDRAPLAATLGDAPATLTTTRAALNALDQTLDQVRLTAPQAQASVRSATALLKIAGPVLAETRPLLADLRPLAADLRPLLHGLNPLVGSASGVLADVNGSVIDRVRGPVLSTLLAPYRGTTPFYKEFAYMLSGLDATSDLTDRNGATIAFDPGVGVQTVGGTGVPDPLPTANAQGVKGR